MTTAGIDRSLAGVAVLAYFLAALLLLPSAEYPRAVALGAAYFVALTILAFWLRPGPISGLQFLAVSFTAAALLAIPTFPAMGGHNPAATWIGALATQAAGLWWAALRWPSQSITSTARTSLIGALRFAGIAALGLSLIATIPIVIGAFAHEPRWGSILWVYPAYLVGALLSAVLFWLLQGVSHLATGRYLLGMLCGICVYAAVSPVVSLLDGKPFVLGDALIVGYIAGGLVGPAVALAWNAGT